MSDKSPKQYAIGLDFGTNSVRALIADCADGAEIGTAVFDYPTGEAGIVLDRKDPNLARQHPADYIAGIEKSVGRALTQAKKTDPKIAERVVGVGVDTTGSTPLPVDRAGRPLSLGKRFAKNPDAMAWLWKDHTSHAEAVEITEAARERRPEFLAKCGGAYSSEWWWSKILHCRRVAPKVFDAAHTWVEIADWIPAHLTGTETPDRVKRGVCAAGHKAMFHASWGGYPDAEFLSTLDPALARVRESLPDVAYTVDEPAGFLTDEWKKRMGLKGDEIAVAVGAFDAHLGAVGSGIATGTLVKIIGTSTCDILVSPESRPLPDVPGICGIVPGSVLPGHYGLEAGQSAVGDIFNWFVNVVNPRGLGRKGHDALQAEAAELAPGASGLLALDWNNGNRTVLVDQRLTGLLLGQTLHTTPAEIYRALVEATAFGARVIIERFEEYGVRVKQVVNCGGIAEKSPLTMQIYADITGRPMKLSRSGQTCALGAAIAGAVCGGAHRSFGAAAKAMTAVKDTIYKPNKKASKVYDELFALYKDLHDAFGRPQWQGSLANVMKQLLDIRDRTR